MRQVEFPSFQTASGRPRFELTRDEETLLVRAMNRYWMERDRIRNQAIPIPDSSRAEQLLGPQDADCSARGIYDADEIQEWPDTLY